MLESQSPIIMNHVFVLPLKVFYGHFWPNQASYWPPDKPRFIEYPGNSLK